jgi:hypothetical protein
MNLAVKWGGSLVAVAFLGIAIYLFAVFQVYLIAWIVEFIGYLFG